MKADSKSTLNRLKRIRGQVEGVIKMVEDDKYCLDISNQLMAVSSAVKSVNNEILSAHLRSCVADSLKGNDNINTDEKIDEVITVIKKLTK